MFGRILFVFGVGIALGLLCSGPAEATKKKGNGLGGSQAGYLQILKSPDNGKLVLYDKYDEGEGGTATNWIADGSNFEAEMKRRTPKYAVVMSRQHNDKRDFSADVSLMKQAVQKRGSAFNEVIIYDHGSSDGQGFGRMDLTLDFVKNNPKAIQEFGKCIQPGGKLTLGGCCVGNNEDLLRELGRLMPHVGVIRANTECNVFWPPPIGGPVFNRHYYPKSGYLSTTRQTSQLVPHAQSREKDAYIDYRPEPEADTH